jgi:hypothetical protein
MEKKGRKARVFKEREKLQQVTHWDLDYLSKDDLYRLSEWKFDPYRQSQQNGLDTRQNNRSLPLLLISIGTILLLGSLFIASRI